MITALMGVRSTYGRRAYPVVGPTAWNSLPADELGHPACDDVESFKQCFKTISFSFYCCD